MREVTIAAVVFAGAGLGGVARHLVNRAVPLAISMHFPLSTMLVNVTGSIAMGLLAGWFAFRGEASGQTLRLFLTTGVLGGFTTFSAFSLDAALLWQRGASAMTLAYVLGTVLASLIGVFVGLAVMRALA
ncbi:MAG: fluoride efflux transporter CrcB [Phenylobacterium sp.]|uniref:fluoride efflux transporter CrcB n=1 Tax=Phenylobacterium sp. TaxID=1871053 RepID=UPI00391B9B80